MYIRMRHYVSGGRHDGREWPPAGLVFEVPDWEGEDLIVHGHAVLAEPPARPRLVPPPPLPPSAHHLSPADVMTPGPEPGPEKAPEPEPEPEPAVPAPGDPKQAWIDYAVSRGASYEQAMQQTKAQLQQAYGGRL